MFLMLAGASVRGVYSQELINITDFGGVPDSRIDIIPALNKALEFAKDKPDVIIQFPKGRYDFWPSDDENVENPVGFNLFKQNRLTIDGGESEFVFHGKMQIANIDSCSNIVFRNFSVDWDRPLISQAVIENATDSYLDVKIDRTSYPYVIEQDTIKFIGEDWKYPVIEMYGTLYDKKTKEIVYNTWDAPLGNIFQSRAEQLPNGIVRFHEAPKMRPEKGTFVSLYHLRYALVGFHIQNSKDVLLKDIQVYHALSHGVLGERTENITLDNTSMLVNDNKGRVFSIIADASHFVNCKGLIKIENCSHTGQGDDFVNVHGRNVAIMKIIDNKTIEVKADGRYTTKGDSLWLIDRHTVQRGEIRIVESITPIYNGRDISGFSISFTQDLPKSISVGDFTENKTWTAGLELRNCNILKRHRARGILVTTPKDVVIENNYFRTAGTAILIEGDLDYWFESGANNNVQIRNNVFEDCLSSGNKTGDRWEWGDAVITITPSHRPQTDTTEPYHKNIHIYNNQFKVFDAPIVRAISVRGLYFNDNEIIKTETYEPYTWQQAAFWLDGCRDVRIESNKIDSEYITRDIVLEHMKRKDIKVGANQHLKIKF